MGNVFITPQWFFGYDVILELLFAIITMMVAYYAFKVYKLSGQRQSKLFGLAFLFISLSYFIQSILNFIIVERLDEGISTMIKLYDVAVLNLFGVYIHTFLFILGILTLTYVTLHIKNSRVYTLLLTIVLVSVFFSANKVFLFYILSSVLLIHTVVYYFITYYENRKTNTLLMLIAMIFLLFSTGHFVLAIDHALYYVLGHFFELIAYILILVNLILVLKNGKKA